MENISLFEHSVGTISEPLASRMRPTTLDEFYGQKHILGENKLLYRMIKANKLKSVIFYGSTGTGKTTLARIIAHNINGTNAQTFKKINATTSGIKDIKEIVEEATKTKMFSGVQTILFIDEIHRFNKSQQDTLLPHIESGLIILIGATTENPYFEINNAIISRSTIFSLKPLDNEDIKSIINRALKDEIKGYGKLKIKMSSQAKEFLSDICNGDARVALNALELAALTTNENEKGEIVITSEVISDCVQKRVLSYDKNGDNHYDVISAFIKSLRGSDPDAGLYYLAKMLESGEDPMFIARRIVISASEDVGNANPQALTVAVSAMQAVHFVGMPEARIILAQAVTYIATSPKSNAAYNGIDSAIEDVRNIKIKSIPTYLKDAHYKGAKQLGHGTGYKYPHVYQNNFVEQQYLPDELVGRKYYNPTENGQELRIKQYAESIRSKNEKL